MTAEAKKKILIVDDHPIVKEGLKQMLDNQPDLIVCGMAENLGTALDRLNQSKPDLVLLDIGLPGPNGLEVLKNIRSHAPKTPVLMLSMHDENLYARRALRAGASGYVMKRENPDHLLDAIRSVLEGDIYLSPEMEKQMMRQCVGQEPTSNSPLEALSDRELEVLTLLGQGHGTRSIAEKLGVSIKTVESHRAHIKDKLNLTKSNELIHFATQFQSAEPGMVPGGEAVASDQADENASAPSLH